MEDVVWVSCKNKLIETLFSRSFFLSRSKFLIFVSTNSYLTYLVIKNVYLRSRTVESIVMQSRNMKSMCFIYIQYLQRHTVIE